MAGLVRGDFPQIWQPVPRWVPGRTVLAYLCTLISLGSGIGLVWRRSATVASRVLFGSLLTWLLVLRLPNLLYQQPVVLVAWALGATGVMLAAAWVLYTWFASEPDRSRVGFLLDANSVRVAQMLYGLSLIPFGLAHFVYVDATTVLIPNWLPWHVTLAYLTGATFIGAGLCVSLGVMPRWAAALSTVQMGLFGLIVWVPRLVAGTLTDFQRGELITTCVLTAGAWVVVDSYRGIPGSGPRER